MPIATVNVRMLKAGAWGERHHAALNATAPCHGISRGDVLFAAHTRLTTHAGRSLSDRMRPCELLCALRRAVCALHLTHLLACRLIGVRVAHTLARTAI